MVKISIYEPVSNLLEAANVCRRCLLRFYNVREYTCYLKQNIEKTIKKYLSESKVLDTELQEDNEKQLSEDDDLPSSKRISFTPCPACLGVLQDIDKIVSKVEAAVNQSQYKFKDFVLQVSLPPVVELRDKLFILYLQAELGESYTWNEHEIPSVKDICKWVVGSQYEKVTRASFYPFSKFQIFLPSSYLGLVEECRILYQKCPEAFPNAGKQVKDEMIYSRSAIVKALDLLSSRIKELYILPPIPPKQTVVFDEVKCNRSPLYLGGRYNKYSRKLSQTPWILEGERRMDSSVSELITDVVEKHIICDKIIFSASGREDVDVRMLGDGRPFVLEIFNPRNVVFSSEEILNIEKEINEKTDLIAAKELQVITKEDTSILKEGEEKKRKTYSAICIVKKSLEEKDIEVLESLKDLKVNQKTPIRVLHRRSLSTREKIVHSMKAKIVDDHQLILSLETQAGTYVKEFVHGDFGRTSPNLGSLLETTADILELDVESIHLDWPPKSSSSIS